MMNDRLDISEIFLKETLNPNQKKKKKKKKKKKIKKIIKTHTHINFIQASKNPGVVIGGTAIWLAQLGRALAS